MKKVERSQPIVFTWKMFLLSFSALIGLMPIFLYGYYRNGERKAARQDPGFTTGVVTELTYRSIKHRRWYEATARFEVNSRVYTCSGKAAYTLTNEQRRSLIGVRLPVIYQRANPANSYLLSSERAFNRIDANLPDSLSWTKAYFTD
ncbi:MAG TPA: DUF3592 domain-containing protein [Fibrella sp.]